MYDFHAHLLPKVDHGARSVEDTARQIGLLTRYGITHAVATPHFYPDLWNVGDFLECRRQSEELIRPLLENTPLHVFCGAEVLISEGIDRMEGLDRLCIEGTNILLLEMPFFKWNDRLLKTVSRLCRSELCVLIAHVDRYPIKEVQKLFEMGAVGQLNCDGFSHLLRRRTYRSWIRQGFVRALGSDIHLPDDFRPKKLGRAQRVLGESTVAALDAWAEEKLSSATRLLP